MTIVVAGLITFVLAFLISLMATPLAAKVAFRLGMLDVPQRHKAHASPTPLLGGSAIFAAILGPSLLAIAIVRIWAATGIPSWLPESLAMHVLGAAEKAPMAMGILAGALVLHVLGLIDDRKVLGPWIKLAVQIVVCACVAMFLDVRMLKGQEHHMGATWSVVVTTIWLVAITNSFNFLDNMDGLCAGVAVICGCALLASAGSIHQYFVAAWLCVIVGAIAGFVPHNFSPAKIFMGDAGSLVIGFLLGVLSCLTTYLPTGQYPLYEYFAPVVLMAVPLYDTISVMVIRISRRSNPMVGDRRHFSHRLVKRGMTVPRAVLTIYVCTGATAVAALLLTHVTSAPAAVLVFFQTLAVLLMIAMFESPEAGK